MGWRGAWRHTDLCMCLPRRMRVEEVCSSQSHISHFASDTGRPQRAAPFLPCVYVLRLGCRGCPPLSRFALDVSATAPHPSRNQARTLPHGPLRSLSNGCAHSIAFIFTSSHSHSLDTISTLVYMLMRRMSSAPAICMVDFLIPSTSIFPDLVFMNDTTNPSIQASYPNRPILPLRFVFDGTGYHCSAVDESVEVQPPTLLVFAFDGSAASLSL